ncbi:pilus assembly protein [Sinorhizobium garamanticum]|uniref:Pilus assembly protein n=1 Tax=Sinorhizobium garamanticum TaxID=680247 RepID=A0ABY8DMJ1_9HYPH|nr:pilus assembly protein [Sinorhizobium garamanticum]WEX90775.1 pilus assembly protein [Sinorhizobium garamanticum]
MPFPRSSRAPLLVIAAALLPGCADYLNHRDSITFGLGNAVEANKGIHTQEPFPRVAQNTRIPGDGKVIHRAIRTYQGEAPGAAPAPSAVILPTVTPPTGTNGASGNGTEN